MNLETKGRGGCRLERLIKGFWLQIGGIKIGIFEDFWEQSRAYELP